MERSSQELVHGGGFRQRDRGQLEGAGGRYPFGTDALDRAGRFHREGGRRLLLGRVGWQIWVLAFLAGAFPDSPHTLVFLSKQVSVGEPITYVPHDLEDGARQFIGDTVLGYGEGVLCCFYHVIER